MSKEPGAVGAADATSQYPEPRQKYVARICFNSAGWVHPSGDAAKYEGETFAATNGFGHEEWLFDFSTLVDGWKYGSIEVKSRRKHGIRCDVFLFTILPDKQRVVVGMIEDCHVLTPEEASEGLEALRTQGVLDGMIADVRSVGGNPRTLEGQDAVAILTVKFRPSSVRMISRAVAAERGTWLGRCSRYQFMTLLGDVEPIWTRAPAAGVVDRHTSPSTRHGIAATTMTWRHNLIQLKLTELLKRHYTGVSMEMDHVDISVDDPRMRCFIEVKSMKDPRAAIREALGQLLEYAIYKPEEVGELPRLVIAAPGMATREVTRYLDRLRARFGLQLVYVRATEDLSELPEALLPFAT